MGILPENFPGLINPQWKVELKKTTTRCEVSEEQEEEAEDVELDTEIVSDPRFEPHRQKILEAFPTVFAEKLGSSRMKTDPIRLKFDEQRTKLVNQST